MPASRTTVAQCVSRTIQWWRRTRPGVGARAGAGAGAGGGGRRREVAHRSNIFPEMKYVITLALALVAACQLRPATKSTRPADTLDLSRLGPPNPRDSALLVPRVVRGPSVVLFWLPAADTLTAAVRLRFLPPRSITRWSPDQIALVLRYCALALFVVALASPQNSFRMVQRSVRGIDIMM